MKSSQGITILELLIVIVVLVILLALLFPAVPFCGDSPAKAQAKNDVVQIATAVTAFETEYGHLPTTNDGLVGGELLTALTGSNTVINPRKIVFLEVMPAKKKRSGSSNGTFVDPWGVPYHIAFAKGTEWKVSGGTNHMEVNKRVAVWSDPSQGKTPVEKRRRYVTSWE